jgi:hypothetical protein
MQLAIKEFFAAFPQHTVAIKPRPDGSLLLSLASENGKPLLKAIKSEDILSPLKMQTLIRELHREIKIEAGLLRWRGDDAGWVERDLPTYVEGPIHVTKAKTLARRSNQELRQLRTQKAVAC